MLSGCIEEAANGRIRHDVFDGVAWRGDGGIATAIGGAKSCAIAADGAGNVYVVWLNVDNFTWDVFFRMYDGSLGGMKRG